MKNKLGCVCGENCVKQELPLPSGMIISVPQCLFIEGIFSNRKVMESMRSFDLHLLEEASLKATKNFQEGKEFWERMEKNLSPVDTSHTPPKEA